MRPSRRPCRNIEIAMPFRPRLWPTVFTIPAVLAMLGLSVWQLDRLAWKTALIDSFESRVTQPPVPPPASIADIDQWRFRSEEQTSELQSLMRISYAVLGLKKKKTNDPGYRR